MRTIILFLSIFIFYSCQPSKKEINDFDIVEKVLVYDSIYSDKANPSGTIMDMEINNGIIVASHRNDEFNYSFIDVKAGKRLAQWGTIGEGPNEFLDFGNGFSIQDSSLVFMDRMKRTLNYVSISDILHGKTSITMKEQYPYNVDFRPIQFCLVGKNKVFMGAFKEGRLGMLDSRGNILNNNTDYPFSTQSLTGIYRGNVFQAKSKSSGKHGKFIIQTYFSDVFEIYQYAGDSLKRIAVSPFNHPPKIAQINGRYGIDYNESIIGLMNTSVTDDFIYFIYSPLSGNEEGKAEKTTTEILCFNWEGEKVKKYILPLSISSFCVDKTYIYGVSENEKESVIYRFKL